MSYKEEIRRLKDKKKEKELIEKEKKEYNRLKSEVEPGIIDRIMKYLDKI